LGAAVQEGRQGIDNGDPFDITINAVVIEKVAALNDSGDGSYPGWKWNGTMSSLRHLSLPSNPAS
jgi:hypothetical protein